MNLDQWATIRLSLACLSLFPLPPPPPPLLSKPFLFNEMNASLEVSAKLC